MDTVRIGVLGAARIAPAAVIRPARETDEAEVVAIAARTAAGPTSSRRSTACRRCSLTTAH